MFNKIFGDLIPQGANTNARNIQIRCPFHDDKTASMSISTDPNKPVYKCFGCNEKGSWIGFFMKRNGLNYSEAMKALNIASDYKQKPIKQIYAKPEPPKKEEIDYSEYCFKVWDETVMHDKFYEFYGKKLFDLRGLILPTAVCCMIGYDPKKGWIFPVRRYGDDKIVGYEVREKFFKHFKFKNGKEPKCYKAEGTPSCLCTVFNSWGNRKAIVCEGFIDSMFMWQYQYEKANKFKTKDNPFGRVQYTILTASCGVGHLPQLVEEAELWNDFDEIIFVLDNDKWKPDKVTGELKSAGNEAKEKLLNMPHGGKFKFYSCLQEGEDFEDFYKKALVKELYKR